MGAPGSAARTLAPALVKLGLRGLGVAGLALTIWDLTQQSNPKDKDATITIGEQGTWVFRSYGTAAGNIIGEDFIDIPELPITRDFAQSRSWGNANVDHYLEARTVYDPLNYLAGPQPAYPAPLGSQAINPSIDFSTRYGLWEFQFQQVINQPRYQHVVSFIRPSFIDYVEPKKTFNPAQQTAPAYNWPRLEGSLGYGFGDYPILQPIGVPAFAPVPRPVQWPAPRLEPWSPEWPEVGPRPQPNPRPRPRPNPRPDAKANPARPFAQGAVEISPYAPPRPAVARGPQPPGRGTKERKGGLPPWAAAVWRGVGPITEASDFIGSVYEALPRRLKIAEYKKRGRQPNPAEKLEIIYRNIGSLDLGKALGNIVANEVEDRAIGKFGKALGQASANAGRPIGYGAGPAL